MNTRRFAPIVLLVLLVPAAITAAVLLQRDGDPSLEVVGRFEAWLSALRNRNKDELRRLSTHESRPYVDLLPADRAGPLPPQIAVHRLDRGRATLKVTDRNADASVQEGFFVLQREDGEWRVDLMETAGRNAREVNLPGPPTRTRLVPLDEPRR